jgi:hypothetical protein
MKGWCQDPFAVNLSYLASQGTRWTATNIQIITGTKSPTPTKLVVVDLDGPEARDAWKRMTAHHGYIPTSPWISLTGSDGLHLYYLAPEVADEIPSGLLWGRFDSFGDNGKGRWEKHVEIRLLADNALVVAPPSVHVETGKPYRFLGLNSPRHIWLPEVVPQWILDMPRLSAPRFEADTPKPAYVPRAIHRSGRFHDRDQVLAAIGTSKLAIAKEWGLQTKSDTPNPRGWVNCYVPHREDPRRSTPSGSFNFHDGTLQDRKDLTTISLFDLGVLLQPGRYRDWREVRDELGDRFIGAKNRVDY